MKKRKNYIKFMLVDNTNFNEYNEAEILDEETLEVNWKYHDIEYLYTKKFWFIKWFK